MSSSIERKLSAIVFTDIVGYTELASTDEESAFRLIEIQRDILKPIVNEFKGEWLKEMGDGLLLSFPSSIQAVECSIKIQNAIKSLDNLNLRIGIHQGDILKKDDDIFGDDVNIASRIEKESPIGGIAISQKVQADISSHPKFKTNLLGSPKLKGVKQSIEIYSVTLIKDNKIQSELTNDNQYKNITKSFFASIFASLIITIFLIYKGIDYFTATKEVAGKTSIAVLNFDNIRKFKDYEWLGDEIAADLSYKLGGISSVRIIDRFQILNKLGEVDPEKASILDYKIEQIAKNIDVDHIIHGQFTIMERDSSIKIIAFLANTKTHDSKPLMKEKYPLANLSDIPTFINEKISSYIKTNFESNIDIK